MNIPPQQIYANSKGPIIKGGVMSSEYGMCFLFSILGLVAGYLALYRG